jgi:hypothetical protein
VFTHTVFSRKMGKTAPTLPTQRHEQKEKLVDSRGRLPTIAAPSMVR